MGIRSIDDIVQTSRNRSPLSVPSDRRYAIDTLIQESLNDTSTFVSKTPKIKSRTQLKQDANTVCSIMISIKDSFDKCAENPADFLNTHKDDKEEQNEAPFKPRGAKSENKNDSKWKALPLQKNIAEIEGIQPVTRKPPAGQFYLFPLTFCGLAELGMQLVGAMEDALVCNYLSEHLSKIVGPPFLFSDAKHGIKDHGLKGRFFQQPAVRRIQKIKAMDEYHTLFEGCCQHFPRVGLHYPIKLSPEDVKNWFFKLEKYYKGPFESRMFDSARKVVVVMKTLNFCLRNLMARLKRTCENLKFTFRTSII